MSGEERTNEYGESEEDSLVETFDRLFQEVFPHESPQVETIWRDFQEHTLPEKTAWVHLGRVLAHTERQVRRAVRHRVSRSPRRGTTWL